MDRRIQTAVFLFKEERETIDANLQDFFLNVQNPGFLNTGEMK